MARPKAKAPARRYHISGQSVVTIAGRDFYLGPHDSPESLARYAVLIGVYQANGLALPCDFDPSTLDTQAAALLGATAPQAAAAHQNQQPILVRHITSAYRNHAEIRYRESPSELQRINLICSDIEKADGDLPATAYGPLRLQAQRTRWVESGKSRGYVNRLTNTVKKIWRHAVSHELIETTFWERLRSVESLRAGQTTAPDRDPVKPVDIETVRATSEHLSPVIRAMLRVQVATGMRPSEVCLMKPAEIDRSGKVWLYQPRRHKTSRKGKTRVVPLIDDARQAVIEYLNRDPEKYLFSPVESMAWSRAVATANRKTPPSYGNRPGTNRVSKPKRHPGEHFTHRSYCQAIQRAAKQAGVPKWHPYQVRHLVATVVRDALGIESAQAALGHAQPQMTQHYAKLNVDKAIEAAKVAPRL